MDLLITRLGELPWTHEGPGSQSTKQKWACFLSLQRRRTGTPGLLTNMSVGIRFGNKQTSSGDEVVPRIRSFIGQNWQWGNDPWARISKRLVGQSENRLGSVHLAR